MLQFTYDFKTVIHVTLIKWEGNAEWMDAVGNAFRNVQIRIKKACSPLPLSLSQVTSPDTDWLPWTVRALLLDPAHPDVAAPSAHLHAASRGLEHAAPMPQ